MAAGIELVGLTKRFGHGPISGTTGSGTTGGHAAVDNIDLSVSGGEFFSLLGPSGCTKTTLRLIAGFEEPTAGRILLDGVDVSQMPSHKRNVYTVFQSYATILPLRPSKASCQLKSLQSLGFDARGRSAGDAFS